MAYNFDDIVLVPQLSNVSYREDADTSVHLPFSRGAIDLDLPIIVSPMEGIISDELILEVSRCGGLALLHRFQSEDELRASVDNIKKAKNWGAAIGMSDSGIDRAIYALDAGAKIICIDVANGYTDAVTKNSHRR